jgi:hypothetical protein
MSTETPGLHELVEIAMRINERPRTHGNGYIQLNVPLSPTEKYQVHFWGHPNVPRQKVSTQIHDHSFGFESHVLRGRVFNVLYDVRKAFAGTHELWMPKMHSREDTLEATGEYCWCEQTDVRQLREGDSYSMNPFEFHELFTPACERAVTVVHKTDTTNSLPRIVVPYGVQPDRSYNRYGTDESTLWQWITEFL